MNALTESKVSLPSPFVLIVFYYYSYFTLILALLLTPLLLYVILTKSKDLKNFKWFILNHSIWCLVLEIFIGLLKPILLTPAPCGYPIELFHNGSSFMTGILTLVGVGLCANCVLSVLATIINRYLLIYPTSVTKWINFKNALFFAIFFVLVFYTCSGYFFITAISDDTSKQTSVEYDPIFFQSLNEKALFFPPPEYVIPIVSYGTIVLAVFIILGFVLMGYFIYLVRTNKNMTTVKFQRSLIISSIMQIMLTCCFLLLPFTIGFAFVALQISQSASFTCILWCVFSTHTVLEFLTILYYVSPYRRFCHNLWKKSLNIKITPSVSMHF